MSVYVVRKYIRALNVYAAAAEILLCKFLAVLAILMNLCKCCDADQIKTRETEKVW